MPLPISFPCPFTTISRKYGLVYLLFQYSLFDITIQFAWYYH
nr:MAG TPA: DASH complex subunit Dad3 [Caudoviricetes sp.]